MSKQSKRSIMVRPAIMITKPEIMEELKHYPFISKEKEELYQRIKNRFPNELTTFISDLVYEHITQTQNGQQVLQEKETLDFCIRDYKNHHFWESIGVITRANGQVAEVFKCSQCLKCKLKNLDEITRVI